MVRWIASGVLFLAVLFNLPVAHGANPYDAMSVVRINTKPAPDFSLPSADGKEVSLSDYRGKVILLGFFKTF